MNFTVIYYLSLVFISTFAFDDRNRYLSYPNSYDSHRIESRSGRRYCGSEITRTLNFLCESYNKRSSYVKSADRSDDPDNEAPNYSLALVKVLRNDNNFRYFRRQIRGVVDDCCRRSCTTTQLAQYCDVVRITTTPGSVD